LSRDLPVQVIKILAHRNQRFQYYLWHRVREGWSHLTPKEQRAVYDINPLWVPPRPAVDTSNCPNRHNGSGEDFLFMAYEMTAMVNDLLLTINAAEPSLVEGWKQLPAPSDEDYPVPEFRVSGLEELKTAEYYDEYLVPLERELTHPDYLRNVNLGELGSDIEFGIYRNAHLRWAAGSAVGYRPTTALIPQIGKHWDSVSYDYLGDTFSCLVNPIFWRLTRWVNDRVEEWKRARELPFVTWRHTWIGDFRRHWVSDHTDELLSIDRIFSESRAGKVDGFYRPTRAVRSRKTA
jgi:hypothetical protein